MQGEGGGGEREREGGERGTKLQKKTEKVPIAAEYQLKPQAPSKQTICLAGRSLWCSTGRVSPCEEPGTGGEQAGPRTTKPQRCCPRQSSVVIINLVLFLPRLRGFLASINARSNSFLLRSASARFLVSCVQVFRSTVSQLPHHHVERLRSVDCP